MILTAAAENCRSRSSNCSTPVADGAEWPATCTPRTCWMAGARRRLCRWRRNCGGRRCTGSGSNRRRRETADVRHAGRRSHYAGPSAGGSDAERPRHERLLMGRSLPVNTATSLRFGATSSCDSARTPSPRRLRRRPRHEHLLNDHYLNGPADLVIEILLRARSYDREVKRRRTRRRGRVLDHRSGQAEDRSAQRRRLPAVRLRRGRELSAAFPGLAFAGGLGRQLPRSRAESVRSNGLPDGLQEGGEGWGDRPSTQADTGRWRSRSTSSLVAPEAKFELIDGKPWVGGCAARGTSSVCC